VVKSLKSDLIAAARFWLRGRRFETCTVRWADAVLLVIAVIGLSASLPTSVHAQRLECPETGRGAIPPLVISDASQIKRMTTGNNVDLANEIGGLVGRLKAEHPTISNDAITNILVAAYCSVVAQMTNANAAEKWQLMRQFDRALMQQVADNTMPQGSLIIANVPLPPAVFQILSSQAQASGQTTVELMAAILSRAAGQ